MSPLELFFCKMYSKLIQWMFDINLPVIILRGQTGGRIVGHDDWKTLDQNVTIQ
jgi:hypothetical protein